MGFKALVPRSFPFLLSLTLLFPPSAQLVLRGSSQGSFANSTIPDIWTPTCAAVFQGQLIEFKHCLPLDKENKFQISWTPLDATIANGTQSAQSCSHQVLFSGTPEAPYGWAGWGVSPAGHVFDSFSIAAYGSAEDSAFTGAKLYHFTGAVISTLPLNTTGGQLVVNASSVSVDLVNEGMTVRILADVTIPGCQPVNVIWRGGVTADLATGALTTHVDFRPGSVQVDFAAGTAVDLEMQTIRKTEKLIHAWLAGLGFGVLMPAGILIARHVKLWADPLWYYTHIVFQVLGYLLGTVGFGFGMWLKHQFGDSADAPSFQNAHYCIGMTIFCSCSLQVLTPVLKPLKSSCRRLPWNLVHWGMGYATVCLAFVNIFLGFTILGNDGGDCSMWRTGYIVFLSAWGGGMLALEPISWLRFLRFKEQEKEELKGKEDILEKVVVMHE